MDIKILIDKFMKGISSIEEEQMIAEFFHNNEYIPKELEPYRKMFEYFEHGMTDGELLDSDRMVPEEEYQTEVEGAIMEQKKPYKTVIRNILAIAASIAVLFVVAYNIMYSNGDKGGTTATISPKRAIAQAIATDTSSCATDSVQNIDKQQGDEKMEHRTPRKFRYKPAPSEVLTAEVQTKSVADSIGNTASQMAEAELRKVEYEQQYMLNLIKAVNMIHSADIAATADEEVY